jgi:hypothetical protein
MYTCSWGSLGKGFTVGALKSGCQNLGPVALQNGSTYDANTLAYNNIQFSSAANETLSFDSTGSDFSTPTSSTVGACFNIASISISGSDDEDMMNLQDQNGNYALIQLTNDFGALCIRAETGFATTLHSPDCFASTTTQLISLYWNETLGSGLQVNYSSGGTVTGPSGTNCSVSFSGSGGGTGHVILTGKNSLSGAIFTGIPITSWSGTVTSGTLSNGTPLGNSAAATCSGTITVTSIREGLSTMTIRNSTTGALVGQTMTAAPSGASTVAGGDFFIGNDENGTGNQPLNYQNIMWAWTNPPVDLFANWNP